MNLSIKKNSYNKNKFFLYINSYGIYKKLKVKIINIIQIILYFTELNQHFL